ncbi:MAG: hypothetical protein P8R42_21590 [Candidatus Binatia bacterium]|nr:hypothetical protein [Candidatus Binatia bacterium]
MQTREYADFVLRQRDDIPALYGEVDFSTVPERLDSEAAVDDERFAKTRSQVARVFDNRSMRQKEAHAYVR